MKDFIKVVKEIDSTLNFLIIFETAINTVIFFLIVYLLLSLINLYPIIALIPAIIYFVTRYKINSKSDKRIMVESKYEPLKEKLRTAADNYNIDNVVVNELQEEVKQDLRHVGLSSFISTKDVAFKIITTILLAFTIVLATTLNLYIVDLNKFLKDLPDLLNNINPLSKSKNTAIGQINESEDIYGKGKLAVLGNKQIDIRIKPVNYEVNVREEGDAEQKQFDEIFPSEVAVEQSSAFEEHIPEEQQELVKNYFNNLAGS